MAVKIFYIWFAIFSFISITQCFNQTTHATERMKQSHENATMRHYMEYGTYSPNNEVHDRTIGITLSQSKTYCKCNITIAYNNINVTVTGAQRNTCQIPLPTENANSIESISCHIVRSGKPNTKIALYKLHNTNTLDLTREYVILPKYCVWMIIVSTCILMALLITLKCSKRCKKCIFPNKTLSKTVDNSSDAVCEVTSFADKFMTLSPQRATEYKKFNSSSLCDAKVHFDRHSIMLTFRNSFKNANASSSVSNDTVTEIRTAPISPEEIDAIVQRVLSKNNDPRCNSFVNNVAER